MQIFWKGDTLDIIGMTFAILRIIFGLAFVLFLPGFSMTLALYITKGEIPVITRFALSFILSIATLMLSTLFLDYVIGVDTTHFNILVTLTVIIILMVLTWKVRCFYVERYAVRPIRIYMK
jgi:uncharacterized membrane protein